MRLSLCLAPRLLLLPKFPHSAIKTPRITESVVNNSGGLERSLSQDYDLKMNVVERNLLGRWKFKGSWERYLDKPLFTHAYAALALKELGYDAVVGIESAGIPYLEIFGIMGFPTYSIRFSYHKKKMEKPEMNENQLNELRTKNNVLLADIDIVTGKTLRECVNHLKKEGVNVPGAYIGLSEWAGVDGLDNPSIGKDIPFGRLWRTCGRLKVLSNLRVYREGILPHGFWVYSGIGSLEDQGKNGAAAANKVLKYVL